MKTKRLNLMLAVHSLTAAALGIMTAAMAGNARVLGVLLPAWGVAFFTVFYFIGQEVRPRPAADLVTGLRLLLAAGYYFLVSFGEAAPLTALAVMLILEGADGLDGFLARRQGPTEFGGIWDMESDAFVILMLSAAAVAFGGQPIWALWPGLIRYVFYFLFLWLKPDDTAFPPALSWFSKTICVAAVFCLGSTWYLPEASTVAIAVISVLLTVSFLWETLLYVQVRLQSRKR